MKPLQAVISEEYSKYSGEQPLQIIPLQASASDRTYFRITKQDNSTILAAHNPNKRENNSFISLTNHFQQFHLHVPQILYCSEDNLIYFLTDLGNTTLFSVIENEKKSGIFPSSYLFDLYTKSIEQLIRFQIESSATLPFEICYPVESFDKTSVMWDLNYFKYYFLKITEIPFEEDLLEKDFICLMDNFLKKKFTHFMFRDFQSRNIMYFKDNIYLIDYQGGRKGPVEYDIASCILDAKADLPWEFRHKIIDYYFAEIHKHTGIHREEFENNLTVNMLIRILQTFGAYGFRGLIQKKELFIQSIPYAASNLHYILENRKLPFIIPHLEMLLKKICEKFKVPKPNNHNSKLTLTIYSFSYKKGIPEDTTSNGGGYVFDCRALPNPGRFPEFQTKTGLDKEVEGILNNQNEVELFLSNSFELVGNSVKNYIERGFTNLMVSYGCTGGQHRSVYCAKSLYEYIRKHFNININLVHRELRE